MDLHWLDNSEKQINLAQDIKHKLYEYNNSYQNITSLNGDFSYNIQEVDCKV